MKKTRMTRSFLATVIPTMEIIKIMSTSLYNSLSVAHLISVCIIRIPPGRLLMVARWIKVDDVKLRQIKTKQLFSFSSWADIASTSMIGLDFISSSWIGF